MNQEWGDCVAAYLGPQGFKVVAVAQVQHAHRGLVKVVRIERRAGQHECPQCGRRRGLVAYSCTSRKLRANRWYSHTPWLMIPRVNR